MRNLAWLVAVLAVCGALDGGSAAEAGTLVCGDGNSDPGEQCDDGNTVGGDGCDANCHEEVCGNAIVQQDAGEACDDGNTVDGDGCTFDCQLELVPCTTHVDCVLHFNNACLWNHCGREIPGFCDMPIPRIYGDIGGAGSWSPPNGAAGQLTDVICALDAFGTGNLAMCPNADIATETEADCPHGNGVVNLTDILRLLDTMNVTYFCDCPLNP